MPFPYKLSYATFLEYSPRGSSKPSENSRHFTDAIKNDKYISLTQDGITKSYQCIEYMVARLKAEFDKHAFLRKYLGADRSLIPIPRSAPLRSKDALWPSRRICEALVNVGLGAEVAPLLKRITVVQKAAFAADGIKRPDHTQHYESTVIDDEIPSLIKRPMTLVDDVVTRGSSFIGMFRRVSEAFPSREISCFALVRTESTGEVFKIIAPIEGTITLHPSGKPHRDVSSGGQRSLF